ncbi:MAG: M1 family metallopeptidase [Chloroflexi bacterium]|nr:MAG: M1 family metallopeptidase [Chloroflexota bacterium]
MTEEKRNFRLSKSVRPSRYELRFELDLDGWHSTGQARVFLVLDAPAREITLHAVDLDIKSAAIDGDATMRDVAYEPEAQTATLRFAGEIAKGERVLTIQWTGEIREALRGLYRSTRPGERYAATQFEAADARRAFPCFDEPEFKARFALELIHPADLVAIANMAVARTEALPDGRAKTRFVETPKISTYLVAFTVGPYESTAEAKTPSGVPTRVWLPRGLAEQGIYARDAHVRSLAYLEKYTDIPYPYGKVDAIGIPDFEAGAMENPGAITYRTRLLAADKNNASTGAFKGIFSTAAHELTHMWWGDLVTMKWWTDLWLNESFASFVGEKATAALNPEWGFWRDFVAQNASAFNLDALASTHPISVEAKNAEEASERFDAITYTKGAAVLRMIEGYLGEDAFREGVRSYLRRYAEANASADDFWRELDAASGQDVTRIANAWIKESGHPLVDCEARERDGGLEVGLAQTRYFSDPDAKPTEQRWPVPLVIKYGTATGIREKRLVLAEEHATIRLDGARWFYPNSGGRGFYRFKLSGIAARRLDEGIHQLGAEERLNSIDNLWALTRHGKVPLAQFMRRLETLRGEQDRAVIQSISDAVSWIANYAVRDATEAPFRRFVEELYRPIFEPLGFATRESDDPDTREKRSRVLVMLGIHGDARDVREEATRRVRSHLDGVSRLDPDVAGANITIAAVDGDDALYDRYVARMKEAAATDAQEEARFRHALVCFERPELARRTTEAIFSELIRPMERGLMVIPLLQNRLNRRVAWPIIRDRWDSDVATAEPLLKQRFVNAVSQLAQPDVAEEASRFLEAKRTADITEVVAQSVERLRVNTAAAQRLADELEDALKVAV